MAGNGRPGFSGDGGTATSAQLDTPRGVAFDAGGTLYISDSSNGRIRKVATNGIITTVADSLAGPSGVAVDATSNLYIVEPGGNRIRKVATNGIITTVAGNGSEGYSGDGGPATSAQLARPEGLAVDAVGNLYIGDQGNNRIRKVATSGIITTVAGQSSLGSLGDSGPATSAELINPWGVAMDATGSLYIANWGNSRIRKVATNGIITTVAGGKRLSGLFGRRRPSNDCTTEIPTRRGH